MRTNYKFSSLCGTVYKQGNVIFTPDGNKLLSPVGNRVTIFDLVNNSSTTLSAQATHDICRLALSPNGNLLFTADQDGKGMLINIHRKCILHFFNFKGFVRDLKFSPDGKLFAYVLDKNVFVWRTPGAHRDLIPFVKVRDLCGHRDDITCINWSKDSRYIISGSKDMTCRVSPVFPSSEDKPSILAGHKDYIQGCFYSKDNEAIYTVSRDGVCLEWHLTTYQDALLTKGDEVKEEDDSSRIDKLRWRYVSTNFFSQGSKVISTAFHPDSNLLLVGFSKGTFGLWELPDFSNIHTISVSQNKVDTVAINSTGEWVCLGLSKFGQLLVWEWQSESYVLKQQGHYGNLTSMGYSPDGHNIATGGQDGKVKLWNTHSGFCFVTFSDHSAPVTQVDFTKNGQVVVSASRDGTVRAFDLLRYRNFRTFTTPEPAQFVSLAVDTSGDLVCAGALDTFEISVWSMQTGKLLDVLNGHEGPITGLSFSSSENVIASGSQDGTVRLWDWFGRTQTVEVLRLGSPVLFVTHRPDGQRLAVSTLDGTISFWDVNELKQVGSVDGRGDIGFTKREFVKDMGSHSVIGKGFTSLCYTADGSCIIAGSDTKYICIYDATTGVLVRRFTTSISLALEGTRSNLSMVAVPEHIDDESDEPAFGHRSKRETLPGVQVGDLSIRRTLPEIRTHGVKFSNTGRAWAAATTEGLLIYTLDDTLVFDPFDLDIDITPASIQATMDQQDHLKALAMAFRLNEQPWIKKVLENIPPCDIPLISKDLPMAYMFGMLKFLATYADHSSRHLEFVLLWVHHLLCYHAKFIRSELGKYLPQLRGLTKVLNNLFAELGSVCDDNLYLARYLVKDANIQAKGSTLITEKEETAME